LRVVVTGGSGFLGGHVAEEFVRRGHDVAILDLRPPPKEAPAALCRFVPADLGDLDSLTVALESVDTVCHLAGVGDVYLAAREPYTAAHRNATGTAHLLEAALRANAKKVVYASTWEVYGEPLYQPLDERHPCKPDHPYNITKYAGELLALSYDRLKDLPVVALRLGTAFGPRMRSNSVFSVFIGRASRGEPLTIQGTGEQARQFTHARDIAYAFALAAESELRGETLNIVSDEATSVRRLAELVSRRFPTAIEYAPARAGEIRPARVSAAKALSMLGWQARVTFDEGLDELLDLASRVPVG
jgi:UDP-glucose 4-epimerase